LIGYALHMRHVLDGAADTAEDVEAQLNEERRL